jgi:hypothetical protein
MFLFVSVVTILGRTGCALRFGDGAKAKQADG